MNEADKSNSNDVRSALDTVSEFSAAGKMRGLYPRWFAAATAAWAGWVAVLVAYDSPILVLVVVAGMIAMFVQRAKQGAWIQEIHSTRELWIALFGAAAVCGVAFAGILGWQVYNLAWVPLVAGVVVAGFLYGVMERIYGRHWDQIQGSASQ